MTSTVDKKNALILWFKDIAIEDTPLVGGKNASLGEMYRELVRKRVSIPNGFAVTAKAYRHFMKEAGIEKRIMKILEKLNTKNIEAVAEAGHKVRELILGGEIPQQLKQEITDAYRELCKEYGEHTDVAVRSSATAEDLPGASFAGQQESYLNIRGEHSLLEACRKCIASLFTNRAIVYRHEKGFDHFKVALSIGVQKMVRSDKAGSGVIFTIDTESGFKDAVTISAGYGLGENIVKGRINPDEYVVFKPTLMKGFNAIISKKAGEKKIRMIYSHEGAATTKNVVVPAEERRNYVLTDNEILTLAKWACIVESHYSQKNRKPTPMDLEWAKDGVANKLFIVQARPETVQAGKDSTTLERHVLKEKGKLLATGQSVGDKIGQGKAHIIRDVRHIKEFQKGDVLVTEMTDPDWVPVMKQAAAIVTNRGGKSCHAAIVSRELGIPCVVGTNNATEKIGHGQKITVSCAEGEKGNIYDRILKFEVEHIDLKRIPKTRTRIMVNIGSPDEAFKHSFLPVDGVGLAREEFIINNYISVHPLALIGYEKLNDANAKRTISELTHSYKDKKQYFIDKLAEGIASIAAAFYPKDVIVRMSDFKSNEYANLIGGQEFEPKEDNPMIGWRGAARYYSDAYKKAFELECKAFLKAREEMGLTNIKAMIPMCRTPEEGKKVLAAMAANGLKQHKNGLDVYVMCEVPSNVILAEQFAEIFDGFSIGSNDLTQFTLAVDRDSELVSHIFNERNEAVKELVRQVIAVAKRKKKKIGICGDAPSSYPEFAEFLVDCGIDSISLSPDAVVKTLMVVAEHEQSNTQPQQAVGHDRVFGPSLGNDIAPEVRGMNPMKKSTERKH
ncbi:phosphoenolpyruvate synthase [Candidatus Woesearchaeota archaeon]|nr:phosphoenolpyruvate synthase [Candidatus Woesearchaeota archaeon]